MQTVWVRINSLLRRSSAWQVSFICVLLVGLVAWLDIITGAEISLSILYLMPVSIATWYGGRRSGIAFGIISALVWLAVNRSEHTYINPIASYWNSMVQFGLFMITEELLSQIKLHLEIEACLSRTDGLTGLANVRGFNEQAEQIFGLAARHRRQLALAYIDVDDFKKVNDELGHGEGNEVLKVIGNKILGSLRASDMAGRLGGDEFAILFPETDEAGARTVCDTLNKNFMLEIQKHSWPISLSIGVVCFDAPQFGLDEAIRIADSLMYQVKKSGKNNILFQHYPSSQVSRLFPPDFAEPFFPYFPG